MSGICGLFFLDGTTPQPGQIEAMSAPLQRRGPDGTHHYQDGPVALGHTLLATTPEALHESLPFLDPASGCCITADVRLDNREELLPALGLNEVSRVIGDGELLLRAYLQWGEACLQHLLGDFAFAIWDPRSQRLFAARDQMGMRQLIYSHVPGKLFAFASEPRAVLKAPGVPRRINEGRIADFIEDYLEPIDLTSTFFEEVYRLPPAHCLSVDASGLNIRRYWELQPQPLLKLDSDQAYVDAFLKVFTQAVKSRLRSAGPVGSMLSGGMDSGSVVAVATRLLQAAGSGPLQTFSAVGPDPESCIETRTIFESIKVPGIQPHLISWAEMQPDAEELLRLLKEVDEPFDAQMNLIRAVYLRAQRNGIKVMLDGVAGDVMLSYSDRIIQLLRSGHWLQAIRDARGEARFWGDGSGWLRPLLLYIRRAITPNWARRLRNRLRDPSQVTPNPLMNPALAKRVNLAARVEQNRSHGLIERIDFARTRVNALSQSHLVVGRERYDRTAAALGIEPRDPFMDLRVVNFCLSLPGSQLESGGWPKILLRRAMQGLLPDAVRWRRGKQHLGWTFTTRLLDYCPDWKSSQPSDTEAINPWLKPNILDASGHIPAEPLEFERMMALFLTNWWVQNAKLTGSTDPLR
ncbi:asparagine synthase (glutamine-hydrolysing) [Pseudomonas pohangensis]|uniref:asparagine synthase (glutamine-hydrolyzing) n=1 Tax=Pseudomonas pohangensis TaxID=364197 RepID=A0A1H2EL66_9PSED|nr:asparagine synthase-related protein [Pseudomonas pohangensis]SDT95922.1 asparagine synthase (glutamine-hydrolysing) [Pseudomonas pohangensis]